MQVIAPDILADARGLSLAVSLTGLAIGGVLWLLGWWSHRFWVVLGTTVAAGVFGLSEAAALRTNPVVAGVVLALAAGILALALVRLLAFFAGGIAALCLVQLAAPAIDQPLVVFVTGGMLAVLLFRLWMMVLTSWCGTVLMVYSGLCLLDTLDRMDAVAWSEKNTLLLNWACGVVTAIGFLIQFTGQRWMKVLGQPGKSGKSDDRGSWFAIGPIAFRKAG